MSQIHQTNAAKIIPGLCDTQIQLSRINRFLLFAFSLLASFTVRAEDVHTAALMKWLPCCSF